MPVPLVNQWFLRAAAAVVVVAVPAVPWSAAASEDAPRTLFRFDEQITESSGLVDLGDRVLTINDSGDDAVVYVVDAGTGATVGRTTYAEEVTDVEAITRGPDGDVWVGDIGDNDAVRSGVRVFRIDRPADGDRSVEATSYDLVYSEGARDAETLLVSPQGRVYVVSKGLFSGQVWAAPEELRTDRPNPLRPVADVGGLVTDGAWFPDGRHVVLRDYDVAYLYEVRGGGAEWEQVNRFDVPDLEQAEGIAVRGDGRSLLVSSEGQRQPVKQVPIPRDVLARMAPERAGSASPDDGASSAPGAEGKGLGALVAGGAPLRRALLIVTTAVLCGVLARRLWRSRDR